MRKWTTQHTILLGLCALMALGIAQWWTVHRLHAGITRIVTEQENNLMDTLSEEVLTDSGRKVRVTTVRKDGESDDAFRARHKAFAEFIKDDEN